MIRTSTCRIWRDGFRSRACDCFQRGCECNGVSSNSDYKRIPWFQVSGGHVHYICASFRVCDFVENNCSDCDQSCLILVLCTLNWMMNLKYPEAIYDGVTVVRM
jgi:hypothetical protein